MTRFTQIALLITLCLIILLTATAHADPGDLGSPASTYCLLVTTAPKFCPNSYFPPDEPTPTPTDLRAETHGDIIFLIAHYRLFSDAQSLTLVDTITGDVALWLEFATPPLYEVGTGQSGRDDPLLLADAYPIDVYQLPDGHIQINVTQPDGITKVAILDSLPVTSVQYSEFGGQ